MISPYMKIYSDRCNLQNIYHGQKCLKWNLWRKMNEYFMTSTWFIYLLVFLNNSVKGANRTTYFILRLHFKPYYKRLW